MQALGAPPADLTQSQEYPPTYLGYGPGQPPQQPQTPSRPPRDPAGRSKLLDYTLKGLGLLGVAVVSGFLWWLFRHNSTPSVQVSNTQSQQTGQFQFAAYHDPVYDTDCAAHATDQLKAFLQQHQCGQLTRSLYTTTLSDGEKVITSVAVVQMGDAGLAITLNGLSAGNGTGHVRDLVEEGTVRVPSGPRNLEDGGYASEVHGTSVIIAITEFVDKTHDTSTNLNAQTTTLRAVSADALRLGAN
jgi:hypothetical protein